MGLPRNKRTVVPLFTFYLKLKTVRQEYDSLKVGAMWKVWERVPEPKSYEQVSLVKLTPPWFRFK